MTKIFYAYKPREFSHDMLLHVLESFYGLKPAEDDFTVNENGKPSLKNGGLKFNITHTDGLIMIAVSDKEVGIDAENVFRKAETQKIAEKYFSDEEREQIKTDKHFYTLWTKKESAIKYAGLSLAAALKNTSFARETPTGYPEYADALTRSYSFDDFVYSITAPDPTHELVFIYS